MEEKSQKQKNREILERWESKGATMDYAKWQSPQPPYINMEPVYEFSIHATNPKYFVESITYCDQGVIWRAKGEINIAPLANNQFCRNLSTKEQDE